MIPQFEQEHAEVVLNEPVAEGLRLMRLSARTIALSCKPAQFVQVRTDAGNAPFLRRPFSVLRADREEGWVEILYDVVGEGTRRLEAKACGSLLDLIGPLGLPFSPPESERLLLVAGGVGLVPLAFLAWEEQARLSTMVLLQGAASKARMPDLESLVPAGLDSHLATDDGSLGHHGLVTDLIPQHIIADNTVVFTCGPHPMMARVASIVADLGVACYASLENHMGCGFGACVGCVVEFHEAEREDVRYRRVCTEGPVVDAHAIKW
ncbi:MAG: dihydroorotate dehydrogenase electron transfer subunit [Candidatus Latescibacteria bacterium]|jgi:dihydroorotate dehydrogenase electron transfer subunit|nr:dihydroorotate dehydrogenase electron transfer subunit [Candidatus Latescibacterota bacterium]